MVPGNKKTRLFRLRPKHDEETGLTDEFFPYIQTCLVLDGLTHLPTGRGGRQAILVTKLCVRPIQTHGD